MTFSLKKTGIFVKTAFMYSCLKDWRWDTSRGLDVYDLWTVIDGCGQMRNAGRIFRISMGDCFLLRPGGRYIASHDPKNPLLLYPVHFLFTDSGGKKIFPPDDQIPPFHRRIQNMEFFKQVLDKIQIEVLLGRRGFAAEWLRLLLLELDFSDNSVDIAGVNAARMNAMNSMKNTVLMNPEKYSSAKYMSEEMKLSYAYFSRLFKKANGISPEDFLINARIECAKRLLLRTADNMAEIAEKTGYRSSFFFSRQFKQKTGLSPKEYRRDACD